MKKSYLVLFLVLLLILSTSLFVFFFMNYDNLNKSLSLLSDVLKLIFSFVTLIVALLIYDRYGLNKRLVEKKTELIIELLIELKKINLQIRFNNNQYREEWNFKAQKDIESQMKFNDDILNSKILFLTSETYATIERIRLYRNHPLLPKSISSKLEFLLNTGGEWNPEIEKTHFTKIIFSLRPNEKFEDRWTKVSVNSCTLRQYLEKYKILFLEIESWIKKYSNISEEINI